MDETGINEMQPRFLIGQHESQRTQVITSQTLGHFQARGYDLLTTPITTSGFQSKVLTVLQDYIHRFGPTSTLTDVPLPLLPALTPEDSDVAPEASNSALIAVISPWIDLGSPDPLIARISQQVLNLEIGYAAFCGICNILVPFQVQGTDAAQYSRAIAEALDLGPYVQLLIQIPMWGESEMEGSDGTHLSQLARSHYVEPESLGNQENDDEGADDVFATWEAWDYVRNMCSYSPRLTVALEVPRQLPSMALQSRWYSEMVRLMIFPRTSFLRNANGFPVLSKDHQAFVTRLQRLRSPPWMLLADVDSAQQYVPEAIGVKTGDPTPAEAASLSTRKDQNDFQHLKYMRHLELTQPSRPPIERFGQGYQDYLQSPLQPLTDNLESITYEVFEKDPVKYEWYENAISEAIQDLQAKLGQDYRPVVAVVGAGRGPLVTRALQASRKTGIQVHCCAVEKNPNAYVVIQRRNLTDPLWGKTVMIFKSDMRTWPGPTIGGKLRKVDVLVSELLGSFADNELSPECLDGVQHVLDTDHGINIPQSYTAHLTPLASPRIYSDLLGRPGADRWGLPYVVMLQQYDFLCTGPVSGGSEAPNVKQAWQFSHPAPTAIVAQSKARTGGSIDFGGLTGGDGGNEHNARSCSLEFKSNNRGVCHGLAGYFETVLYAGTKRSVELSINPVNMDVKSKDMISWFPIFFPLKVPLSIPDDSEIQVNMWRQTNDKKVWYEWTVTVFKSINGKRVRIGMSELNSSQRNGCLL